MDKIYLNNLAFYGYHGVLPEETRLGQRFNVNLVLESDLSKAGNTDDLKDTVNYAAVYDCVRGVVEGPPRKLLESVAETLADTLLQEFPLIHSCIIKVIKPDPPIPGHYESVAVEIQRGRS
ncbi:MAG TPA: dihydroneopterin aldolase [Candidatus Angelobacter sp.]|nr:dihydroneopterin aldolase [Candidatus Angelobacter sp.]